MTQKTARLAAALILLLACAPAFAVDAGPLAPKPGCANDLTAALPWLQVSACPQSFCNDDQDCLSQCPSDPGAYCSFSTWTCVYSSGPGPGSGSCQSNSICSPGRFCFDNSDCASCTGGCAGYCAADGVCRLI